MKKLFLLLCLLPAFSFGQLMDRTFIKSTKYKIATPTTIATPTVQQAQITKMFYDGLGRPNHQINYQASPTGKNIVQYFEYDILGRESRNYLPYVSQLNDLNYEDGLQGKTVSYYQGVYDSDGSNPYSEKFFEASPLNKIMEQTAPGLDWLGDPNSDADHTIKLIYSSNLSAEVRKFTVSFPVVNGVENTEAPSLLVSTDYEASQLFKTVTKDENWNSTSGNNKTTQEFKDKEGRVILKRSFNVGAAYDTYYVYDKYGNLTYVIPPLVTTSVGITNISTTDLDNLCYQYKYDYKNRLIEKKQPGKGWEYLVYDKLDRIVLTQDNELRNLGKWIFTKYDKFNRIVLTGKFSNSGNRVTMQAAVTAWTTLNVTSTTAIGFTMNTQGVYYTNDAYPTINHAIPTTSMELLTVNYYDDYRFVVSSLVPTSVYGTNNVATNVNSLPTGSVVRVLNSDKWITNFIAYDKQGNPIYQYTKDNYLDYDSNTKTKLEPITGLVLEITFNSNQKITTSSSTYWTPVTITDYYTYDHAGRVLKHTQRSFDNTQLELIAYNNYNELGQLVQKKVGGYCNPNDTYDQTIGLQTIDYGYNIRGWLTSINRPATSYPSYYTSLFTLDLNYNSGTAPMYNGNISNLLCKTPNDASPRGRGYDYFYDDLNRLTSTSNYLLSRARVVQPYNETIQYDKNGNITNLTRGGWLSSGTTTPTIDQLSYSYSGNKLDNVLDTGTTSESFIDGNTSSVTGLKDYWYDENGNMTRDLNKGIGSATAQGITYNHLNLPVTITFNSGNFINYVYDATGKKLEKRVTEIIGGSPVLTITQYHGKLVYQKTSADQYARLQFSPHDEGYAIKNDQGNLDYVYQYKDHLGNVRVSYKGVTQLLSSTTFDTSAGGFAVKGGATSLLQYGAMVVNATGAYQGVRKNISSTAVPGQRFKFNIDVDRGTTDAVRVFISEADPATGLWTEYLIGHLGPGEQTLNFDYVVKEQSVINLTLDKEDTNTQLNTTTNFKLLNFEVYNVVNQIVEENNYYPFGLTHKGYNFSSSGGNSVAQKYKYNGKELQDELGLNMYDYGARNYDPALGRWMNIDPLAEKYFKSSPFAYVNNSPIVAFDPDGQKILFINGHYNGYLGWLLGSSAGGKEYWGNGFASAAQNFFNDYSIISDSNYIDGSSMFGGDSSGSDREQDGYEYAEKNYSTLINGLGEDETFKLVTHSEGSAFGAGIARYLMLKGHKVESIVHLSSDEGDEFDTPFGPTTYQLSYGDDWVTGNKEINNVSVYAIVDKFQSWSDKKLYAHGSTRNADVFKELKALLKIISEHKGVAGFRSKETKDGITFEVIRNYTEQEDDK
jgi:RHS repeat-associated protein